MKLCFDLKKLKKNFSFQESKNLLVCFLNEEASDEEDDIDNDVDDDDLESDDQVTTNH